MADVTLEVFCFLMLDQDLLIVKLAVTVPEQVSKKETRSFSQHSQSSVTTNNKTHQHQSLEGFLESFTGLDISFLIVAALVIAFS